MATLVLSTVGTILGGPVGGAIGSLVGQSIDQQLLGPEPRHGPRLGDLSVQSSAYGTPIPRLFGTIRVAGSIVWSTDLKEDSQTQGAKGQPDSVTYSYSASFAVALSCRPIGRIGRIWADGKLLRGVAGDFKVSTGFRFHPGTEDQQPDPLIASIEGIGSTPGYRGIALAVFENLQLAEYGNRIPFLTFEVEADPEPPPVGLVLAEASDGVIQCPAPAPLRGYAAHGPSVQAAVQPLVEHFGIELFDDGARLRTPTRAIAQAIDDHLGCSSSGEKAFKRQQAHAAKRSLPSVLTLGYYDPAREYQNAQMRASMLADPANVRSEELPAVLTAGEAKALAEQSLARRWTQRDVLTLRLPPRFLDIEPGQLVTVPGEPQPWAVARVTIDGLVAVADLHPSVSAVESLPADPGRSLPPPDVLAAPITLALVELPDSGDSKEDAPVVVMASVGESTAMRPVPVELEIAGAFHPSQTSAKQAVLGRTATLLAPGQAALLDLAASCEVELVNGDHWLQSCDDAMLAGGANLAMVGSELIQFGEAVAIGAGRFRLSRLLRARRGTEWAMGTHAIGERFVLLDPPSLARIDLSREQIGAAVVATPRGLADSPAQRDAVVVTGEAMRPPSPVHLRGRLNPSGGLECSWCRRSRFGWAWLDGVEVPLGASRELYRLRLEGSAGAIEFEASEPFAAFTAAEVASLGLGTITLSVAQVGDFAVSRPKTLTMNQEY